MRIIVAVLMIMLALPINGQETIFNQEEQEVFDVVVKLFDGMRAGDSSMVHQCFAENVRMYTSSRGKDGELTRVQEGKLGRFLTAVGTPHDQIWDEKIWNTKIDVEMGVAQVWTDYAFYVGDKFSHCGIDAFQLIYEDGWKIIQLIDTRKKMNCEKPKE